MLNIKVPTNLEGKRSKIAEILENVSCKTSSVASGVYDNVRFVIIDSDNYKAILTTENSNDYLTYEGRADKKLPKWIIEELELVEEVEIEEENEEISSETQKTVGYVNKDITDSVVEEEKKAYEVILKKAVRELGNGDYTIKVSVFDNSKSTIADEETRKVVENTKIKIQLDNNQERIISIQDCVSMLALIEMIGEVENAFGPFSLNFKEDLINIKDSSTPIKISKIREVVKSLL